MAAILPGPRERGREEPTPLDGARLAGPAASQLPALFLRPEHLRHRQLDDAPRDKLARLPPHAFGAAAGRGELRRPDSVVPSGPVRRGVGRAPEPPQTSRYDPGLCRGAIVRARRAHARARHYAAGDRRPHRNAGHHQRLRHARAAIVSGADGRGPRRPQQRHRHQLLDGLSYFAVIASLLMMRIKPLNIRLHASSMIEQMREGWDYVRTFRPIRTILLLLGLISLMGYSYAVLLPVFAAQVLHGNATTLGWLTGASGVGALISALSLAVRKTVVGLTRMVQIASATLGGALILFGLSHTLWLSLLLMVFVGFGLMQTAAASNTIIQALVPEDKRARAMSYYTMAFFGGAPFGSLLAGTLAHRIGAPHTVFVTGTCCLAGTLWFTLELPKIRAVMRPIYRQMGLLPVVNVDEQ